MRRNIDTDSSSLLLAAVQSNPTLGDIGGNVAAILLAREQAMRTAPALDLLVCSELALCCYPPEDLLLDDDFLKACEAGIETLQRAIDADGGASILLGTPRLRRSNDDPRTKDSSDPKLFNAAVLLSANAAPLWRDKSLLPNYGIFDEKRYFTPSTTACSPMRFKGFSLGVMICEDMWQEQVAEQLAQKHAALFVVLNASPFEHDKAKLRLSVARERVEKHALALLYVNQVGGQDELLFDGGSFALNDGEEPYPLPFFEEATRIFRFHQGRLAPTSEASRKARQPNKKTLPSWQALCWQGVAMGIRDYVRKNNFQQIVLGLSGGIDSALCATLACDALGAECVRALLLPSRYTSPASIEDARALSKSLGFALTELGLEQAMASVQQSFETAFGEACEGLVAENIQARLRAVFLMAYANHTGALLLSTSNKSESATGYTTLYGDMSGGYAPLKDLYKTQVFALARWRNKEGMAEEEGKGHGEELIPQRILTKAPSAELRFDQRDEDALAPYEQLDAVLQCLIERRGEGEGERFCKSQQKKTLKEEAALVKRVRGLLRASEHKRYQSPPGPKVGGMAFGRDRRYPIVNRFCEGE